MARVSKGVSVSQEITVESKPPRQVGPPSRWQENHGNLLMGFVAIVFVVGGGVLIYRQNRFVPPRFPEADMIDTVPERVEEVDPTDAVSIQVTGAANDAGRVEIAVYASKASFNQPGQSTLRGAVSIFEGVAVWPIPSRIPKRFAVVAYHDENGDGELNRNQLGIPTERYGFSGNARGTTAPPSYDQAVVDAPPSGETINVFIR